MNGFYPGVGGQLECRRQTITDCRAFLNTYGIFYNKKLFQDAGFPSRSRAGRTTISSRDMAKLASKKGGVQQYGYYGRPDPFMMSPYSVSAGGAPFADSIVNPTKVEVSPQFIEGVTRYQKAIADGSMIPPTFDLTTIMGPFKDGKVRDDVSGPMGRRRPDPQCAGSAMGLRSACRS